MSELLTDAEHAALDLTGKLTGYMWGIIGGGSDVQAQDFREVVIHIHALQQMIMSQAAARAYPEKYRLLGNVSPAG